VLDRIGGDHMISAKAVEGRRWQAREETGASASCGDGGCTILL
jgi:hypothetical protein